jgi:hypothetical protein
VQSDVAVPQFNAAPVTVPPVGRGLIVIVYGGPGSGPLVDVNVALQVLTLSTWTVVLVLVPVQLPPQLVNA